MNSIITLVIILAIYFYIYKYHYDIVEEKYHYYFYIGVIIYIIILYLFTYEYEFIYKLLKNVHETTNTPLYNINSYNSNLKFYESQNNNINIKPMLLNKQNNRCYLCNNFILDINDSKLKYIKSLQYGGNNDINNICLICNGCYQFNN
jgi:hypothetical protein